MSTVYNPEAEVMAEIERGELEARDLKQRIAHAHSDEDKRVLNRQLGEVQALIAQLQSRLPH